MVSQGTGRSLKEQKNAAEMDAFYKDLVAGPSALHHFAMKGGELDEVTLSTFAWIRNRPTAAEREME